MGTSGWSYNHWQGVLYPPGTPVKDRLGYYLQRFQTVEVNSTFYRWPKDATFSGWARRLPEGFQMSVKAPRFLTHYARLGSPERWLERITSGLQALGDKRAVLLVQLPPQMPRDDARLSFFLSQVPSWIPVAVEFRHPSWHQEEVFRLLEQYRAAYCVMSGAQLPCILRATAPFVYIRLHGPHPDWLYAGSYSDADLHWWADRIREWLAMQRDVYAYFNNDVDGNAVRNAETLIGLLRG